MDCEVQETGRVSWPRHAPRAARSAGTLHRKTGTIAVAVRASIGAISGGVLAAVALALAWGVAALWREGAP